MFSGTGDVILCRCMGPRDKPDVAGAGMAELKRLQAAQKKEGANS